MEAGVETDPDFEPAWIETPVRFHLTHTTDAAGFEDRAAKGANDGPSEPEPPAVSDGKSTNG